MTFSQSQAARADGLPKVSQRDQWLIGATATLLLLGLVMVGSATVASGDQSLGINIGKVVRHGVHLSAGLLVLFLLSKAPLDWWLASGRVLLAIALISLVVVILPGVGATVNASTRWIDVAGFRIQPTEPAKLIMVIYTAGYLVRKQEQITDFVQGIVMIGVVLAALAVLLLIQPDFGSLVVLVLTVGMMLFLAGVRLWHFLLCVVSSGAVLALLVWMEPYRLQRVTSFLDPWGDPFGSGFQLVQALIAFGRGEWIGVGLGASIQKLYYLPHAGNDFLLAVIGEELGFLGVTAVLALFCILLWRSFSIARMAQKADLFFAARLAEGIGMLLAVQAMVNIGVNLGALPTKGITLPLMSYGGSSLITSCAGIGLLLAIHDQALRASPTRRRVEPRRNTEAAEDSRALA